MFEIALLTLSYLCLRAAYNTAFDFCHVYSEPALVLAPHVNLILVMEYKGFARLWPVWCGFRYIIAHRSALAGSISLW